jgi:hypothetical protein
MAAPAGAAWLRTAHAAAASAVLMRPVLNASR